MIYNQLRADIQQDIRNLCKWKGVEILDGHRMPDYVHLLLSILTKYCVSSFMGLSQGKISDDDLCETRKSEVQVRE